MVYVSASTFSHGLSVASQLISVSLGCITEYWPHLSHWRMYSLISAFMLGQKRHSHTLLQHSLTSMWELSGVPSCFGMVLLLGWQGVLLWRSIQHKRASHHSTFSRDLTQQEGSSCLLANQLELLPQVIIGLLWFVSEFYRCSPLKLVKLKAFTVWRSPWVFLLETKYTRFSVGWGTCEIFSCKQCWCQTLGCWETFLGVSWVHVLASS